MCGSSAPTPPKPIPPRQAARMPDQPAVQARSLQNLMRRASMSATTFTNPNGSGDAPTRGVALLGQ